jgi:hypothetical protein
MAINTVVTTDDLTVFGPPNNIELQVDIGPEGQRGSIFFSGTGDPNSLTFTEAPKLNDLFIRTDLGGNYGTVYKYVSVPAGSQWQSILTFQPITYNSVLTATFNSGSTSLNILLNDFYLNAPSNLQADSVSVQLTPQNELPLVLSISDKNITTGSNRNLVIDVVGVEYSGGSWTNMSGSVNIGVNLSII